MHRERSSGIASLVEHPGYSIFKTQSVLILFLFLWFATFNRKCICKSHLFLKLEELREGSSFIVSMAEHPVYRNFKMYSVLILSFRLATIQSMCMYKSNFFLKLKVLREERSFIASFVEHPAGSNFKLYSVLILVIFVLIGYI